jgi:hypothetical protein
MNTAREIITAARAAALFVSDVSVHDHLTGDQVDAVIRRSVHRHGGTRGCAADVAAAYGDHPELAAPRMRWALDVLASTSRNRAAFGAGSHVASIAGRRRPARAGKVLATAA